MRRLPCVLVLAAMVVTTAFVLGTTSALPDRVATHFGPGGLADGWMTPQGYRVYMLAFALGFVPFIVAMVGLLPRAFPGAVSVPNRTWWLAPERREATLAFLLGHACRLGVLMAAMLAGVHWLVLEANQATPPRLATAPFVTLLVAFLVLLGMWLVAIYRRFRAAR